MHASTFLSSFALITAIALRAFPLQVAPTIELGNIVPGRKIPFSFVMKNDQKTAVAIGLTSLCPCVTLETDCAILKAGEARSFTGSFDPSGLALNVERGILINVAPPFRERRLLRLRAYLPADPKAERCVGCEETAELFAMENRAAAPEELVAELFAAPDCESCRRFLAVDVPRARSASSFPFLLLNHSAYDQDALDYLDSRLAELGIGIKAFPVLVIGTVVLQGDEVSVKGAAAIVAALQGRSGQQKR